MKNIMKKKDSSRRKFLTWLSAAAAAALSALVPGRGASRETAEFLESANGPGDPPEREADFWRPLDSTE